FGGCDGLSLVHARECSTETFVSQVTRTKSSGDWCGCERMTEVEVPFQYGTQRVTLPWLRSWLLSNKYHPEYVERLVAWLASKGGAIGVGGGRRAGGAQPNKAGFAPEGKSFHQDQNYVDGHCGPTAVDLVATNPGGIHRTVQWSEVLPQGSAEAAKWGLHCNVSNEPWHMQPIEIDGWQSWRDAGRPAPKAGYPFPGRGKPAPQTFPKPDRYNPAKGWYGNMPLRSDKPTLEYGRCKSPYQKVAVRYLKNVLRREDAGSEYSRKLPDDKAYGPSTRAAVLNFQARAGLKADSICGPKTWAKIDELARKGVEDAS